MTKFQYFKLFVLAILVFLSSDFGLACSGYKITMGNKTLFGSNEDAWRVTPHIWFENGTGMGKYGAAFTGSRHDGINGYAPQTGMNEMGLVFERLAAHFPGNQLNQSTDRQKITNPTLYLKEIMHRCSTVEEVQAYFSKYDHSFFMEDVFIYVDKTGKYLIAEPFTLTIGNDPTFVISNFCPSVTSDEEANKLERYRNGVAFLNNNIDTTLAFCTALSDTMHVCREKIGDGTLLTSVWDLNNGTVNLFFYHNFDTTIQFNLKEELAKGNHRIAIDSIFPVNSEFENLRNYKTPKNTILIGVFLVTCGGLFLFTSLFFLISYFRKREKTNYAKVQLLLFPLGLLLFYYMIVLSGSISVFYFSSPYKDPSNIFVSISSFIPFVMLLTIIPFLIINFRLRKNDIWSLFAKGLFTLNNLVYIILIGLFFYWGFYQIFTHTLN